MMKERPNTNNFASPTHRHTPIHTKEKKSHTLHTE